MGRYGGTYASEADVLNMALFGMTAKQWRDKNPDKKGNIRDYASINKLICLSNMENINAVMIEEGLYDNNFNFEIWLSVEERLSHLSA